MKEYLILICCFLMLSNLSAQKSTCDSPKEEAFEDLNTIIAKCTVVSTKNKPNKSKQLTVRVSAPKMRFFKKRKKIIIKKANKSALALGGLQETRVSKISKKINTSLSLVSKEEIIARSKKISREEVLSASKFSAVERLPSFDDCKRSRKNKQLGCFNNQMIKHIQKHFQYPADAVRNQMQGEVWVRFIIDKQGYVRNIKTLGPDDSQELNDEAIRVVSKLPKFKPAKINGKDTAVKYGFPINFSLEE